MRHLTARSKQRVLIICRDPEIRNNLCILLSAYGYLIDHAETRKEGIRAFLAYKHSIIIIGEDLLPRHPRRMSAIYEFAHRLPLVLILVPGKSIEHVYPYLRKSAYGLIHLPIDLDDFSHSFERAIEYNHYRIKSLFLTDILLVLGFFLPILSLLVFLMVKNSWVFI